MSLSSYGRSSFHVSGADLPFHPLHIDGLALWLDASDLSTITESGGSVSQWDDKSGNGRHVTQGTAANQPSTGVNTLNGLNVIAHDTDDFVVADTNAIAAGTPFTFMMAWRHTADNFILYPAKDISVWVGAGQSGSTTDPESENYPGDAAYYKNGASVLTDNPNRDDVYTEYAAQTSVAVVVGSLGYDKNALPGVAAYPDHDGLRPQADVAEVLLYSAVLSEADRQAAEQYMADKWGVTLS